MHLCSQEEKFLQKLAAILYYLLHVCCHTWGHSNPLDILQIKWTLLKKKIEKQMKRLGAWSHEMFISRVWVNSFLLSSKKHSVLLGVHTLLILNRASIHDQNKCTRQWSFCCIWISRQECCYLIINTTEVLCFCRDCKLWRALLLICSVLLFRDLKRMLTSL